MTGHLEIWTDRSPALDRSGPCSVVTAPAALRTAAQWDSLTWHNTRGSALRVVQDEAVPHAPQIVTAGR